MIDMKKLLLIAIMFAGMATYAQTGKARYILADSVAIAVDSVQVGPLYWDYNWNVAVRGIGLNAADATATIEVSNYSTGPWVKYDDNAALTIPANGTIAFEDSKLTWIYLRVKMNPGTATAGRYDVVLTRIQKQ